MTINFNQYFSVADFEQSQNIIVALSGGSDSLALLFLLRAFLQQNNQADRLVAITIDHGLRCESSVEAQGVHALCNQYHIKHDIFVWQGDKPKTGISDKARTARYNLLCQAARLYNSKIIVTGHTLDDQIETFRMRQQRLNQGRGLAGMARQALLQQEFILLRPLLHCKRSDLRSYLQAQNIQWVDDPSNDNLRYERVRIRKNPIDEKNNNIQETLKDAQYERQKAATAIAELIKHTNAHWLGEQLILNIDEATRKNRFFVYLIEILAALIGGKSFLKPLTTPLIEFIRTVPLTAQKMTHCACLIENRPQQLRLWREQRNLKPIIIKSGEMGIWDGRFAIYNTQIDDIVVRAPLLSELQNALNQLAKNDPRLKNRHVPSLLTALLIEHNDHLYLPSLAAHNTEQRLFTIAPVLMPFHWLASGHDFAMLMPLYELLSEKAFLTKNDSYSRLKTAIK